MRPTMPVRRAVATVLVALVFASGCSIQLLSAPMGATSITARFDNVLDLVQGHTVQLANVVVGSVTKVERDGYQAKVTMSIVDSQRIPAGTKALVRRTSLLGEHFVDLQAPPDFDRANGAYLDDGDTIETLPAAPELEDLAGTAGEVVAALSADDFAATMQAATEMLVGNGPALNHLIAESSSVVAALNARSGDLARVIDSLGQLGSMAAPMTDEFGQLLDAAALAVETMAADRDRFFTALESFNDLATVTNDTILVPHAEAISSMLETANAIVGSLASNQTILAQLLDNFAVFVPRVARAVSKGQLLLFAWLDLDLSAQSGPLPPFLSELIDP